VLSGEEDVHRAIEGGANQLLRDLRPIRSRSSFSFVRDASGRERLRERERERFTASNKNRFARDRGRRARLFRQVLALGTLLQAVRAAAQGGSFASAVAGPRGLVRME